MPANITKLNRFATSTQECRVGPRERVEFSPSSTTGDICSSIVMYNRYSCLKTCRYFKRMMDSCNFIDLNLIWKCVSQCKGCEFEIWNLFEYVAYIFFRNFIVPVLRLFSFLILRLCECLYPCQNHLTAKIWSKTVTWLL